MDFDAVAADRAGAGRRLQKEIEILDAAEYVARSFRRILEGIGRRRSDLGMPGVMILVDPQPGAFPKFLERD